jgi:deazaflavin-dependent oxidoreductase (nitroreductase family)
MPIEIPPNGTRGSRTPGGGVLRTMNSATAGLYRLTGGRVGHELLITTVGAKTGQKRTAQVRRFDDGDGRWLVVGSAGGSARHPSWFYNLARNPDKVSVQIGRDRFSVTPELLTGTERDEAWGRIVAEASNFKKYETTTDRQIPVVRLTRAEPGDLGAAEPGAGTVNRPGPT